MTKEELYYLPASELLKHIQAEKERLIKEKVIKKSKPLPPIKEEEKPYELPKNWEWVRHNELFEISGGSQPPKSQFIDSPQNGYIRLFQIRDYGSNPQPIYIPIEKASKTSKKGDILLARYGASLGKVFIAEDGAYNVALAKVIPLFNDSLINMKFMYYYYNSDFYQKFTKRMGRSAQAGFNKEDLDTLLIPLPPLYIQDQIVQKLEQLSKTKDSLLSHAESQLNYTKKTREALLQEAIRGELVPQDENDEPASILLEKIKAEKERLIKEKVIKKQKELPPITDEEKPYDLPEGWEWVRLGDIGAIIGGGTPKTNISEYWTDDENGIPWLTPADLSGYNNMYISKGSRMITNLGLQKSSTQLLPKGSVIFSSRAPIGYTVIADNDICTNQGFKSTIPYLMNMNKYIYWVLKALVPRISENASGTTFKEISGSQLSIEIIPLPPLAEQERIVTKLDELMANCDQLEMKAKEMKNYTMRLFEANLKEAFMPE